MSPAVDALLLERLKNALLRLELAQATMRRAERDAHDAVRDRDVLVADAEAAAEDGVSRTTHALDVDRGCWVLRP